MSECALNKGIFSGRSDGDEVARELIRLTKAYTEFGFAVSLNQNDYEELIGPQEGMRTAYAFALLSGMHRVRKWRERSQITGPTAFFFESGHQHESNANAWLAWMLGSKMLAESLGYRGEHIFVPKSTPALHPADNLSWHWRLETVRARENPRKRATRKDLIELRRADDFMGEYSRERLLELQGELKSRAVARAQAISAFIEKGVPLPTWQ